MQLLVNPTSYQNAQLLITKKVHRIFVGTKEFSVRNSCLLTIEEIGELVKNKNQTEIIILVNKLFFEFELEKLEQYILAISKLNIDGIMYADYAVNQILFENNLNHIHQIYNPDTLVTNYEQFPFYLQNNIHEVSLARELTGTNIVKCIENKKEMKVQVQVGGYGLMLQSRWELISNFSRFYHIDENLQNRKLFLKEPNRKHPFIIYEDSINRETYMFTAYNLFLLKSLTEIKNIDCIRIDSFLHNEEWTNEIVDIFLEAIAKLENNETLTNEFIQTSCDKLKKYDEIQSAGFFYISKEDLIYLPHSDKDDKLEWNNG